MSAYETTRLLAVDIELLARLQAAFTPPIDSAALTALLRALPPRGEADPAHEEDVVGRAPAILLPTLYFRFLPADPPRWAERLANAKVEMDAYAFNIHELAAVISEEMLDASPHLVPHGVESGVLQSPAQVVSISAQLAQARPPKMPDEEMAEFTHKQLVAFYQAAGRKRLGVYVYWS